MSFFKKLVMLLIVLVLAYVAIFTVRPLKPGRAIMVEDMRSGTLVRVISGKYCFAYEGAMPWWFSLKEMSLDREFSRVAMITIPCLSALDDNQYDARIPLRVKYQADPENPVAGSIIMKGDSGMDDGVFSRIQAIVQKELDRYLDPLYKRDILFNGREKIEAELGKKIKEDMKNGGITISSFSIDGGMYLPTLAEYNEAVKHLDEMTSIKRKNDLETVILTKKLERDKMADEEYYKKLTKMSGIIKNNPDILKYIYIDKLSDKIKVVSPVESPDFLGDLNSKKSTVSPSKGDIDNLR